MSEPKKTAPIRWGACGGCKQPVDGSPHVCTPKPESELSNDE